MADVNLVAALARGGGCSKSSIPLVTLQESGEWGTGNPGTAYKRAKDSNEQSRWSQVYSVTKRAVLTAVYMDIIANSPLLSRDGLGRMPFSSSPRKHTGVDRALGRQVPWQYFLRLKCCRDSGVRRPSLVLASVSVWSECKKAGQEHVQWRCALLSETACGVWYLFSWRPPVGNHVLVSLLNQDIVAKPTLQTEVKNWCLGQETPSGAGLCSTGCIPCSDGNLARWLSSDNLGEGKVSSLAFPNGERREQLIDVAFWWNFPGISVPVVSAWKELV